MKLGDYVDLLLLEDMIEQRYVSEQKHPTEPLAILNYTQRAQYDRVWNDATRKCRGLIYDFETGLIVARPWPKFFNLGEPVLNADGSICEDCRYDIDAPVRVTDKLDGSLGILYPTSDGHAIATRGSFTSEQALHATEVWRERYSDSVGVHLSWPGPAWGFTFLFEILYPENRIVVDYEGFDDLVLLGVVANETGLPASPRFWPGPRATEYEYRTLREALEAEPRPNAEGLVVYFLDTNERVKLKQEDYVALHRILTGTNARNVWEVAAVLACAEYVAEPKHWGSFLGIDPARAEECLALGEGWLEQVPDEFHDWVRETTQEAHDLVHRTYHAGLFEAERLAQISDRASRYRLIAHSPMATEIMRIASAEGFPRVQAARNQLWLRCWREACPEPTAPFARSEAVA